MKFPEAIRKAAFLGMKDEAEDIVDFILIRVSLIASVLAAAILAVWIGRAVGVWAGASVGVGTYAVSMRICTLTHFPSRHRL